MKEKRKKKEKKKKEEKKKRKNHSHVLPQNNEEKTLSFLTFGSLFHLLQLSFYVLGLVFSFLFCLNEKKEEKDLFGYIKISK